MQRPGGTDYKNKNIFVEIGETGKNNV